MAYELKDYLKAINESKEDLMKSDETWIKKYPAYIINRCLSGHLDSIMFANEMNKYPNLDKDLQYSFYLNTLRKKKRFSPWLRKDKVTDLEIVKQYYGYSNEKASQALRILTPDQINFIKYQSVSEFPSSTRDFSFSITDIKKYDDVINHLSDLNDKNLKDAFIFDFYENK